jgi:tetratricopeptide (TPR) repeat protein/peroxiredoxin
VSRSPTAAEASPGDRERYNQAWSAIYELIDQGHSWSGRERNCCFLNTAGRRFANISASSGLDYPDDGRGLAACDWDFDGRPDFWVTNRTGPRVRFLRNETKGTNHFLAIRLQGVTCNRDAIGARVEVSLAGNTKLIRTLRAGEGFIAQSTKWLHFGLGKQSHIDKVVVRWPERGAVETFNGLEADGHYVLVQGAPSAQRWRPPTGLPLAAAVTPSPPPAGTARTWLVGRVPAPQLDYRSLAGNSIGLDAKRGRPLLVNLWSTTCRPCLEELTDWSRNLPQLDEANVRIVALAVDHLPLPEPDADMVERVQDAQAKLCSRQSSALAFGLATKPLVEGLEIIHRAYIDRQQTLPVPCSFLLDANGRVAAIYKGPVTVEQLLPDLRLLDASPAAQRDKALPFAGRWASQPFAPNPRPILARFVTAGMTKEAQAYCRRFLDECAADPAGLAGDAQGAAELQSDVYRMLGALLLDAGQHGAAIDALGQLRRLAPHRVATHIEISRRLAEQRLYDAAADHLATVLASQPDNLEVHYNLALLDMNRRRCADAVPRLEKVLAAQPQNDEARYHLAGALLESGDARAAIGHYRAVADRQPTSPAANNLAWILATHRDDTLRDATEAIRIAERVCKRTSHRDVSSLDTLAASYAEAGRFADAVATIEQAISFCEAAADKALLDRLNKRLVSYQAKRPWRE